MMREKELVYGILAVVSLLAGAVIIDTVASSNTQSIAATGTLDRETFSPRCYPECLAPSFIAPILISDTAIYILASNDPAIKEQLLSSSGLSVKVSGFIQSFNASVTYPNYTCSPYACDRIRSQISVTSFQLVIASTVSRVTETRSTRITTTTSTTAQTLVTIPGFPLESIIIGALTGAVVFTMIRRSRDRGTSSDQADERTQN